MQYSHQQEREAANLLRQPHERNDRSCDGEWAEAATFSGDVQESREKWPDQNGDTKPSKTDIVRPTIRGAR
jgi:hypothetical protein